MIMRHATAGGRLRWLALISGVVAVAALLLVLAHWRSAGGGDARPPALAPPYAPNALRSGPKPIPEPMKIAALTPDQARASNAGVPMAPGGPTIARPFVYAGRPDDRASAQACLAAAAYYEAGDDAVAEQAVAQVVLNRLRHPAFPKTVCGVVFEGSSRRTGCQFTFSCDASLSRLPPPAAVIRARKIAELALSGLVSRSVGLATYYHADWVVPYWRDELDKVAVVHGQIFYRWRGAWGRPAVFEDRPPTPEQPDPRIAAFGGPAAIFADLDDESTGPPRTSLSIAGVPRGALKGAVVRLKDDDAAQYVLQLSPGTPPGSFAVTAFTICADKPDCLVLAWADERDVPRALPVLPIGMRALAFMYRKSSLIGEARPSWDCRRYPRPVKGQCLPGTGTGR